MTTIDKARELEEEKIDGFVQHLLNGGSPEAFFDDPVAPTAPLKKDPTLKDGVCEGGPSFYPGTEKPIEWDPAFQPHGELGGGAVDPEERWARYGHDLKATPEEVEAAIQKTPQRRSTDLKDTNPKDAIGIAKVPMSTMSGPVMMEVGLAMMEGALKYGRHNFRDAGVRASVYFDALMRHAWSWWEGEDIDPDSQLNHITKAISTLMVLRDSMITGNWVDDRPPKVQEGWIQEYNKKAKMLLEKIQNPVPAHTQLKK